MSFPSMFEENSPEYHAIKIEHPLLNYYGISAMSTGQLVKWWNQKNYRKEFSNRNYSYRFGSETNNFIKTEKLEQFLNLKTYYSENPVDNNYTFKTWRKQGYNGRDVYYLAPKINTGDNVYMKWSLYEGGIGSTFDVKDSFCPDTGAANLPAGATVKFTYEDLNFEGNYNSDCDPFICLPTLDPEKKICPDGHDHFPPWFYRLINSHNSVISAYSTKGPDVSIWPKCLQARKALSDDIMIGGGLVWSGVLGFDINLGNVSCTKKEWVKYSLQLFDATNLKKRNDNFAAMRKIFLSGPAADPLGRTTNTNVNGGHTAANEDDISQHKVGELSVTWNPVEKKYESGTLQLPAILYTDIAASNSRTADFLDAVQIEELLNDPTSNNYLNMPTGIAIPLVNMNGNPSTIAPTYEKEDGCRDNNEKFKLIVYNPFPKAFKKDTNVMLSKINGVWIPLDAGMEVQETKSEFLGKWDFSYFMTNLEYYFTNYKKTTPPNSPSTTRSYLRYTAQQYERYFREQLYSLDDTIYKEKEIYDKNVLINLTDIHPLDAGFVQITSWDFMRKEMGGRRDGGNAIAGTVVGYDLGDNPTEKFDLGYSPRLTNPFFGCVFPNGYDVDQVKAKYNKYKNNTVALDIKEGDYFSSDPFSNDTNVDTKDIFIDDNVNIETTSINLTGPNAGIFSGINNGIYTLRHLPADIALNSSRCTPFSAQNGSPLRRFEKLNFLAQGSEEIFKNNKFNNYYIEKQNNPNEVEQPVWNLRPNVPNRIQFRPMKIELYASAEWRILNMQEYKRRFDITQPTSNFPPPPNPPIGYTCNYLKAFSYNYCAENDPRLRITMKPDFEAKTFAQSAYAPFASMRRARGKFAARAALMVKDFYDAHPNYNISGSFLANGINQDTTLSSPLWGPDGLIYNGNWSASENEWRTLFAGTINDPNWTDSDDNPPKPNNPELIRGLEAQPSAPYHENPFALRPRWMLDQDGGQFVLSKYNAEEFEVEPALFLGLAYGKRDFFEKGKRLAHMNSQYGGKFPLIDIETGPYFSNFHKSSSETYSLGAIGIIGASCVMKVPSPNSINLKTDYNYGHPTNFLGGKRFATYLDLPGNEGLTYANTTGLYAKIYQFWPKHLTFYDPRYFTIHHFNEGGGKRKKDVEDVYYVGGIALQTPTEEEKNLAKKQTYPTNFTASKAESSVDLRSPTFYNGNRCESGEVFYDSVDKQENNKPLRNRQHWNIFFTEDGFKDGRNRRGRLLPYYYEKTVISLAKQDASNVVLKKYSEYLGKKIRELAQTESSILYFNLGKNYQVGDTLTVTAGTNVVFTVTSVAGKDETGFEEGAIKDLVLTNAGEDFDASDFMKLDQIVSEKTTSAAKVVNLSVKSGGSGFVGYVISGQIRTIDGEDKKPKLISGDMIKLTKPVNNDFETSSPKGPISDTLSVDIPIPEDSRSDNGLYDIFLHFHNDASHVHGHPYNLISLPIDQYINLELN